MTDIKNNIIHYWERLDESWRFAIIVFTIARVIYALWSWVIFTIQPVAIQNFELSGEPIFSIFKLENSQAYVYLREVNGDILTFIADGENNVIDQQTGSVWNISNGKAIQGVFEGLALEPAQTGASDIFPYYGITPYPGLLLAMWQRFDANWYTSIAEKGYGNISGDDHFPPLFPLLIRVLQPLFGNTFLAGLFTSHVATLIALKLLYDVYLKWGDEATGKRALLYFVIYPTFFFFFSAYSESIFLVMTLLALRAMNLRRWAWAGFWIFCAILTRLQGAALLAPMLYLMWQDRPIITKSAHWIGLIISGLGGFAYLYLRSIQVTSNAVPLVESDWHARLVPPWETYWYAIRTLLAGKSTFIDILNWLVITFFLILLVWGWKFIPVEYNLYTTFSILIILIRIVETQPLISMSRYSLTLFPVFYMLGIAGRQPLVGRVIIYTSLLLGLYLSGQFFIWGWVA